MMQLLLVTAWFLVMWGIPILLAKWIVKHKIDKGVQGW